MDKLKTLYLHGLNSSLTNEKRAVLESYAEVRAPNLDYFNQPDVYQDLSHLIVTENVEVLIGSSMGGCLAYHLSLHLRRPALVFNPALPRRSVDLFLPEQNTTRTSYLRVIIGAKDDIVPAMENFRWISDKEHGNTDIIWRGHLGHRIDTGIFEKEVSSFFNSIAAQISSQKPL
jgi:hypothetical protein